MQFSIPEGTRDLLQRECRIKRLMQNRIETVFERWGYEEIITPAIEYYRTYQTGFMLPKDEEMYKFFDQQGQISTLRMDMTVPIARLVAARFKDQQPPFRFRYCANVYKVKEHLAGKQNEVSDCGIELIGMNEQEGDLEVLCCACEVIDQLSLKDSVLEIGNVNFFHQACLAYGIVDDQQSLMAELIDRKNLPALHEQVSKLQLDEAGKAFFLRLPWLCGKADILDEALAYCFNDELRAIVLALKKQHAALTMLSDAAITYDLSKVPHLNYYSGLIFEVYAQGAGSAVISGGRYDHLIEKFGKAMPAIGFSIKLDQLLPLMSDVSVKKHVLVYPLCKQVEALKQAALLRQQGIVELRVDDRTDIVWFEEG